MPDRQLLVDKINGTPLPIVCLGSDGSETRKKRPGPFECRLTDPGECPHRTVSAADRCRAADLDQTGGHPGRSGNAHRSGRAGGGDPGVGAGDFRHRPPNRASAGGRGVAGDGDRPRHRGGAGRWDHHAASHRCPASLPRSPPDDMFQPQVSDARPPFRHRPQPSEGPGADAPKSKTWPRPAATTTCC
jgi:hypothetical protein